MTEGWYGCDLDGTLAYFDEWHGWDHIGPPIPKMVERVKRWLAEGKEVRIVTARASPVREWEEEVEVAIKAIEDWCLKHIGQKLPVTCSKDMHMEELWDDRAIPVETNTGFVRLDPWHYNR